MRNIDQFHIYLILFYCKIFKNLIKANVNALLGYLEELKIFQITTYKNY
jgi:hypothetical protein